MAVHELLNTHRRLITLLSLLLVLTIAHCVGVRQPEIGEPLPPLGDLGDFRISGPFEHDNLALYLVHRDQSAGSPVEFMTLELALQTGMAEIKETGEVNRLSVRNLSSQHLFIQAGDIIRGGKQDRLIAHDLVVEPNSDDIDIESYCVESGRWTGRGSERTDKFSSSSNYAVSNSMKQAYRVKKSQGEVWSNVEKAQAKLTESLGYAVQDARSPSSMELTLENPAVKKSVAGYVKALDGCISGQTDAVGVVAVINGELYSGNIYAWTGLFEGLWPKTLSALATEAIAMKNEELSSKSPLTIAQIGDLIHGSLQGKAEIRKVGPGLQEHVIDKKGTVSFVSRDEKLGWARAELLKK